MRKSTRLRARARSESAELAALFKWVESGDSETPEPGVNPLRPRRDRIRMLLNSPEHSVRVQTERLLLEQEFGKPRQQVEHSGELTHRPIFEEHPPDETADEWKARMGIAQSKLEEFDSEVSN